MSLGKTTVWVVLEFRHRSTEIVGVFIDEGEANTCAQAAPEYAHREVEEKPLLGK